MICPRTLEHHRQQGYARAVDMVGRGEAEGAGGWERRRRLRRDGESENKTAREQSNSPRSYEILSHARSSSGTSTGVKPRKGDGETDRKQTEMQRVRLRGLYSRERESIGREENIFSA
eukprot:762766-Hanusia_phi.AAC.2